MTPLELIAYYKNLLIIQYNSKPKALATIETQVTPILMPETSVQTIAFVSAPSSGSFVLSYDGVSTPSINWNDSTSTIQTKLQTIPALSSVIVTGTIAGLLLTVTFANVDPVALLLELASSSLNVADPVITEIDVTLPISIEEGFNLIGSDIAIGAQLDVLGKYAGVTRAGFGFTSNITLNDSDFLSLIRVAIAVNTAGSSLSDIEAILNQFFPGEILVFDYKTMRLSYLISESVGSQDLVQLFVAENLLPRPMGVRIYPLIYAPTVNNFFGFRTYELPAYNSSPFNTYSSYSMNSPWMSYSDAIIF